MALTFCVHYCWRTLLLVTLIVLNLKSLITAKEVNYDNLEIKGNELSQQMHKRQYSPALPFYGGNGGPPIGGIGGGGYGVGNAGCPLCDSSVYSYCSYKILHDSCCCDFPVPHLKPQQCYYNDCSLLYAKSCYEFSLIKNCCCSQPY